jgi:16S rRNA (guanine1516-N2)-methyltransferase
LVGADSDAGKLLEKAMRHAKYRTVVKRSNKSPGLTSQKPNVVLKGKSTRYDIYINRKLPPKC